MKTTFNQEATLSYLHNNQADMIPTMVMPIVQEIAVQKFRVSIFSSGSSTLLHDAVENAISHLAVRQKYLDQGYAAHQLQIMRVY